jgi:hypothetical protein
MKPAFYTIRVYQNAAFKFKLTYKDEAGNPIDLSGYSGEFVIRRMVGSTDAVLRSTSITFGSSTENVVLTLTATETDELPTNNREQLDWVYEMLIWDPADKDGTALRLVEGTCEVHPSVARADGS